MGTGLSTEFYFLESIGKLLLDDLEIFDSDALQSQCLLMVLAGDGSDTDTLGGLVFIQLTDSHSLCDDTQLIDEPFNP